MGWPILNNSCAHILPYVEPETSKKFNHAYLIRQKRWTIFSKNNNPCAGTIRYPRVADINKDAEQLCCVQVQVLFACKGGQSLHTRGHTRISESSSTPGTLQIQGFQGKKHHLAFYKSGKCYTAGFLSTALEQFLISLVSGCRERMVWLGLVLY